MLSLYVWVSSKISPFEKGLQVARIMQEMTREYADDLDPPHALEGGSCDDLLSLLSLLEEMPREDLRPFACNCDADLNGAIVVGIILGEDWDKKNRRAVPSQGWQQQLLNKLIISREVA